MSKRVSLGACCPSGVRLYRMDGNSLRVHWRSSGSSHAYITELLGSSNNYTCTASPGHSSCDIAEVQCGDVYNVVVAPLTPEGSKVLFCAHRLFSGRTGVRPVTVTELKTYVTEVFPITFSSFPLFLVTCSGSFVGTGEDALTLSL